MKQKLLLAIIICLLSGYAFSQKKGAFEKIPFINNIQQYNIKEGDVANMRVNVYSVAIDKNGNPTTKSMSDYAAEISFDTLGNRVKEVIYGASGEMIHTNVWDYDVTTGIVGQYQLNEFNQEVAKKITIDNKKEKTVNIKKYGEGDTLLMEEKWMIGASGKTINTDRYLWDIKRNVIGKKTSKSFDIDMAKSIENLINELGDPDDYSWLPSFMTDWQNARNKKTQIETLYDGSQIIYVYDKDKDLMTDKKRLNSKGEIVENINYKYEFDGNGNWTKAEQYINGKPITIVIRTFEFEIKPIVVKKKK